MLASVPRSALPPLAVFLPSSLTCSFLLPSFFPGRTAIGERRPFSSTGGRCDGRGTPPSARRHPATAPPQSPQNREAPHHPTRYYGRPPTEHNPHCLPKQRSRWLTNLEYSEPPPPQLPPTPLGPAARPDPVRDESKRLVNHGDSLTPEHFRTIMGINKPPDKENWMREITEGPYLPMELRTFPDRSRPKPHEMKKPTKEERLITPRLTRLLVLLEAAQGMGYDLLAELVVEGQWKKAVWIVRALLEPVERNRGVNIMDNVPYTRLDDGDWKAVKGPPRDFIIADRAGTSALRAITDHGVRKDVFRRSRGLGIVLGSLVEMIFKVKDQKKEEADNYTDVLPTIRQILAYLHTSSLVPESIYSATAYPRLHILRPRILTSLADAVWRAQEGVVAEEAAVLQIEGIHRGMEVPRARYRLQTWGSGSQDIEHRPPPPENPQDAHSVTLRELGWGAYIERELWIELVMAFAIEAGYGSVGLKKLKVVLEKKWKLVEYEDIAPEEYTPEYVGKIRIEEKSDEPERWGVEGYSLARPPVTTLPRSIPVGFVRGIVDALADTMAEGRGIEGMIDSMLELIETVSSELIGNYAMRRLFLHPHLRVEKGPAIAQKVAEVVSAAGQGLKLWYGVLEYHIKHDNIHGAMRIWKEIERRQEGEGSYPEWVLGTYLMALVRARKLDVAWALVELNPAGEGTQRCPPVARSQFASAYMAPALLALSKATENRKLVVSVSDAISEKRRSGGVITHSIYTSLLATLLHFREFSHTERVIEYMYNDGFALDAVDVAVVVENALQVDRAAGYKLVESASGSPMDPATASTPSDHPMSSLRLKMSYDAWISVLSAAVSDSDAARTKWVLENLHVDMSTGRGMTVMILNILLRGVVQNEGSYKGMQLYNKFANKVTGRNLKTIRTVLDAAKRERLELDKMHQTVAAANLAEYLQRRKRVKEVMEWAWEEMKRFPMGVPDMMKASRQSIKTIRREK